jgi:lipoyl(octanoyl) transferase
MLQAQSNSAISWRRSFEPVGYGDAVSAMERRVEGIVAGAEPELVWLLEHPPLYTAGTSAQDQDLLERHRFPVHPTGRGGQYTYHGPGQRVAYVMLNLTRRGGDLHAYVSGLERWLIATLADFGVTGEVRKGRVGVWVARSGGREDKIAAIGVRVRRGVSYHGVSLNVAPDLEHFSGIVPCGIRGHGVTSLADLGVTAGMDAVDAALNRHFEASVLGPLIHPEQRKS